MSNTLTAREYQERAALTNAYPRERALEYVVLGLASEAGEVAGKLKKGIRDGTPSHELRHQLLEELGDVLWYCAALATELDTNLDAVMHGNLAKLEDRKARGVLQGSGDNR